ncbi:glycoside hydrolase family 30 beta sandwich domain-containing protein [Zavarzinella formosa]|uniref:glycoside hydrolase family 30 beta sandwich domain-containing protein n=1 Tax=Zavarzinella formosa TaxID=360055 RepID=UPI000307D34E|nr:glycoside hydrolase family 30 beta sandwich domain-containing protein [Zavarzinella formosa]
MAQEFPPKHGLSQKNFSPVHVLVAAIMAAFAMPGGDVLAQEKTQIIVQTARPKQVFDGLGVGAIFYEGHITSLSARDKKERQEQLYDDMFKSVPTRYLQLMIRETHEPQNDNNDPLTPAFDVKNFEYCRHTIDIAKAALKRQPDIQLYATLYTPPPWMKTNNEASAGGEARATIKPGMELELAEYAWAFLAHMQKNDVPIKYLSISNEPDWPHTQPGYCLTPEKHAALFKTAGEYLDKMAKKFPEVPRPKLVGPNTLSAPGAAKDYVPLILKNAGKYLDVVGAHDYDPRGDRWGALRKLADKRPVWVTEWCPRTKDSSPGMINSATEYGNAMHEAFVGGANVFMAYDWVYPPRDTGEALIHVKWGEEYTLTKPYHLFRQWASPLKPGMRVVEAGVTGKGADGAKPTAFLSADGRTLVVHIVNMTGKDAPITLKLTGKFATVPAVERTRTSATEDVAALPELKVVAGSFTDTLPARSMVTYRHEIAGK